MALVTALILVVSVYFFWQFWQEERGKVSLKKRINGEVAVTNTKEALLKAALKIVSKFNTLNSSIPLFGYKKELENKLLLSQTKISFGEFIGLKELCSFLILIPALLAEPGVLPAISVIIAAFFLPDLWLREKRQSFEKKIFSSLPFALDLITACAEAGLTFDAAVVKYIKNSRDNPVKTEFQNYLSYVSFGKTRKEALESITAEVGIKEFSSFCSAIIQSIELGSGMAKTLRTQASRLRVARTQQIEKLAMQAPVKLIIPLVLFIFPVIFIMLFGPLLLRLIGMF